MLQNRIGLQRARRSVFCRAWFTTDTTSGGFRHFVGCYLAVCKYINTNSISRKSTHFIWMESNFEHGCHIHMHIVWVSIVFMTFDALETFGGSIPFGTIIYFVHSPIRAFSLFHENAIARRSISAKRQTKSKPIGTGEHGNSPTCLLYAHTNLRSSTLLVAYEMRTDFPFNRYDSLIVVPITFIRVPVISILFDCIAELRQHCARGTRRAVRIVGSLSSKYQLGNIEFQR